MSWFLTQGQKKRWIYLSPGNPVRWLSPQRTHKFEFCFQFLLNKLRAYAVNTQRLTVGIEYSSADCLDLFLCLLLTELSFLELFLFYSSGGWLVSDKWLSISKLLFDTYTASKQFLPSSGTLEQMINYGGPPYPSPPRLPSPNKKTWLFLEVWIKVIWILF